jgi:hypothetical protein
VEGEEEEAERHTLYFNPISEYGDNINFIKKAQQALLRRQRSGESQFKASTDK